MQLAAAYAGRYAARVDGIGLVGDGGRRGMERAVRGSGRARGQAFARSVRKGVRLARQGTHNNRIKPTD